MSRLRTRFAPAPTGYLHLGHVVNALYVWGEARRRDAEVLLRIEDHDRQRCREEYEAALLEDLAWLGFVPDLPPPGAFQGRTEFRQSDNDAAYRAALDEIRSRARVYACGCSRRDIEAELVRRGREVPARDAELPYPGTCRERGLEWRPGLGLRVVVEPGVESFNDLLLGPVRQDPSEQCGDLLLKDRLGNWTYHFAVVVDDLRQQIGLVVRGEDLLESTGRQIRLARLLGREAPPQFLHHPLVRHPGGAKLSKSNRDTGIRELRARGLSAGQVLELARRAIARPAGTP